MAHTMTLRESVFAYQKKANDKLCELCRLLGVDLQPPAKPSWKEEYENVWRRNGSFRDRIEYIAPIVAIERELFDSSSVIKSEEPDFAYVDDFINSLPQEVPWTLEYTKGETVDVGKEEKDTAGTSIEQAIQVSGSYGGVEFSSTTTVGAKYEKEKLKTLHEQSVNERKSSIVLQVPEGAQYRAEQRQAKATIEVKDHVRVIFDIAFKAWCHADTFRGSLVGNSVIDNKRIERKFHHEKHTSAMLIVKSTDDFHEILTGASADFPHQNVNLLDKYPKIEAAWNKLIEKKDRAFEAIDITEFTKTSHGTLHVLDANTNHVVREISVG